MQDIVTIIQSTGFPIAVCVILMWYVKTVTEKHSEETKGFMTAISALTEKISVLVAKIDALIDEERRENNGK